jgi:hypothetical protein
MFEGRFSSSEGPDSQVVSRGSSLRRCQNKL